MPMCPRTPLADVQVPRRHPSRELPWLSRYARPMRRTVVTVGLVVLTLALCSPAAIAANRLKAMHSNQPSAPSIGVLPVISCSTTYGARSPPSPFVARQLPTTSSTRGLSFYSNGLLTVLAPSGWACSALVAGDGGQKLDVYPPGKPDYASELPPKVPSRSRSKASTPVTFQGPSSSAVWSPSRPRPLRSTRMVLPGPQCQAPTGERTTQLTPDVVAFNDPLSVRLT